MKENCLFRNITVVTADDNEQAVSLPNTWVAIKDGIIAYVGSSEILARSQLDGVRHEIYDGSGKIMLPTLANTHGHVAMTLMRNQADDLNLHDWLFNVIFPRETRLNEHNVYVGTQLGIAEMIRSGTGAAADMYYFSDSVARAALDAGFRLNFCCDAKTPDANGQIQVNPKLLTDNINQYHKHPSGLLQVSLLVHSVYLYDATLYPELSSMALDMNCPVQVHISETRQEQEDVQQKYGCTPTQQLEKFGFFKTPTIAAHCVYVDETDRQILVKNKVVAAHNPSSNLKLGSGIADIAAMFKSGMRVALGTDGAASNNNLDLYREIRLASFLAKGTSGDAATLPAAKLIDMATREGMIALGFKAAGCITAGCLADFQIIDCDRPSMTPLGDPVAALVYSADASCVESLMVDGQWLMKKRELLTIDEEKLLFEARKEAAYLNGN